MLFNCTSECSYPSEPFGGNVRRYAIDDHNVPLIETAVNFCKELEELTLSVSTADDVNKCRFHSRACAHVSHDLTRALPPAHAPRLPTRSACPRAPARH